MWKKLRQCLACFGFVLMVAQSQAKEHVLLPPTNVKFPVAKEDQPCLEHQYWQQWFVNNLGKDWKNPVNYVGGMVHLRFIALQLTKPTEFQICIYWDGSRSKHGCSDRPRVTNVGDTAYGAKILSTWWHSHPVNWENIGPYWRVILRPHGGKTLNEETVDPFLPLEVNVTVVMIAKNDEFSGWGNYPADGSILPPAARPKFTSSETATATAGQAFGYRIKYDTTGCRCKPLVRYIKKPVWLNTMADSLFGVPSAAGTDTVVAVLEKEKQPQDTLVLTIEVKPLAQILTLSDASLVATVFRGQNGNGVWFNVHQATKNRWEIEVRSISGKLVWRHASNTVGKSCLVWDPKTSLGTKNGIYFVRFNTNGQTSFGKFALMGR